MLAKVKFLQKLVISQGHRVKTTGTNRKVLLQGIHICNIKALSLLVQKLLPRLIFFSKVGHKVKIFGTDRKILSQGTHICNMKALSLLIQKL